MSETLKEPGANCPKCNNLWPAEHQQMGQKPRWECQDCGAKGKIVGSLSIAKRAAPPAPAAKKEAPPWARRNLTRG